MNKAHKYKTVTNGKFNEDLTIYCEHCGFICFSSKEKDQVINDYSENSCKLAPEPIVFQIGKVLERLIKLENEID